jgi:putative membrane protein
MMGDVKRYVLISAPPSRIQKWTCTVNGLRQLVTAEQVDSRLWIAITFLSAILLASLTASALSVRRNRRDTMEPLYPPIEV